jgi:hypothetical protein
MTVPLLLSGIVMLPTETYLLPNAGQAFSYLKLFMKDQGQRGFRNSFLWVLINDVPGDHKLLLV